MSKLFNFLKRNFMKIIWSAAILVWVGVGIYYFSTRISLPSKPLISPESPTPATTDTLEEVESIVGNFQKWETIANSQDKYIFLTHPETNKAFPKIRVGFEFSVLYGDEGSEDITVFAVEKDSKEYDVLYALKYFSDEEIDKLIKKDDWVEIYFQKKIGEEVNLKDENSSLLAHGLTISRPNGRTEIEQELERAVQKPQNP